MTTIKRTSICLILLVFSTLNSSAQSVLQKQYRELQATLSDYEVVRLIPSDIEAQVKEGTAPLELNLKGETFRFRMEPRDLRSPRYRAEATGPDGVRRPLPLDEVTTYRGMTVSGQEVVQGRFTIDGDRFEGVVFTSGDWTFIESLQHFTSAARGDEWVVYRQSDIKPGQEWRCGVSRRLQEGRDRLEARAAATDTTTTYKVEVATEADYEYVQYWGGSATAANREIRAILNQVEGVYETELKLKLEIIYQHAWTHSSDPYSGTDGVKLLEQFKEYWNANFASEGYDLAHLWTDRETVTIEDEDGEEIEVGGQASRGTVCHPRFLYGSWSYGYSRRYTQTYKFTVAAHEIGHNFGAGHPNEEEPPVASCAGTIMWTGERRGELLTFCQFSRNEIRSHVSTYNSCLEAETETITLRPPSNVTAEALGPHRVQISWRNTNGENSYGYSINRREPGGRWKLLVYQFKPSQEFIDGSVGPESTYSYRMYAYNTQKDNIDSSSWSRTVTATTPPVPTIDPGSLTSSRHIPHIAQGKGWSTWLYILNICSRPVTFDIDLWGEDGRRKSFSFQGDDENRYNGIYNGEEPMDGKDIRLYVFPDTGSELLQGFGHLIDNGEGCVSVDTEYRQMRPDGEVLFSTVPLQRMTTDGLVFALSGSSCSMGVAIAGTGERVRIEAVDYDGNSMGSANLGNVYHTAFALKDKLPQLRSTGGQLRIIGEAAAVGLEFCDGELAQFRLPHYIPPGSN